MTAEGRCCSAGQSDRAPPVQCGSTVRAREIEVHGRLVAIVKKKLFTLLRCSISQEPNSVQFIVYL
jgi:hypothetical protein